MVTAPALCHGLVMHQRLRPVGNRFVYPLFYVRAPLSAWDRLRIGGVLPLLRANRPALLRLDNRDHGPRDGSALEPWIRTLLCERGVHAADGEVVLQAMPRVLGFVFNPVSFWFCHDRAGALRAVLCEVNNTFGERHNYLVHHADQRPIASGEEMTASKVFHVSPFLPVRGEYHFRFSPVAGTGSVGRVAVDVWQDGAPILKTRISARAGPLTAKTVVMALVRYPLMTLGVVVRIHWQALRLWRLRVPFFRKPLPPIEETSTS